ncbi:MAG: hypothetical protein E7377_04340 [Clostridiales bacterium]|nr:hypothetical protein [Clostridiales bacterium]
MGVDKVILRSILSTLAAIAVLFAFMFVALIGLYPSTMMEITYDLGMDSSSIKYAERAYGRSNDVYYIAYATEIAIGMDDNEKISACGEKLIADDEFAVYCAQKNEILPEGVTMTYDQYVYGQVCVSKYKCGQKTEAVERAFELLCGGFPKGNAVVAVLYSAMADGDSATVAEIEGRMKQISIENFSMEEKGYIEQVFAQISKG